MRRNRGALCRPRPQGHAALPQPRREGLRGNASGECRALRTAEARRACRILNARAVFAGQIDREASVDGAHYDAFRLIPEAEQHDIVFTRWPIDGHRDHRAMSTLVYDAWRRKDRKFALFYFRGFHRRRHRNVRAERVCGYHGRRIAQALGVLWARSQTPGRYYALHAA